VGPTGPQGPSGFPTVTTLVNTTAWNSQTDNTWRPVPGLQMLNFQMAKTGAAEISWQVAVPMNGHIVTRLAIDGVVQPGTNMVVGNTTYATTLGAYYTNLQAGTHKIEVQYRTIFTFTYDPTADFQAMRLQVLAFDQ